MVILLELRLTGIAARTAGTRALASASKSGRPRALRRERKALHRNHEQLEAENRSVVGTSTPSLSNPSPMRWFILSAHGAQMPATWHLQLPENHARPKKLPGLGSGPRNSRRRRTSTAASPKKPRAASPPPPRLETEGLLPLPPSRA